MAIIILLSIVALIFIIVLCRQIFGAIRLPRQSIIAFTGTLGSGKTYLAVKNAVREYRKQRGHYKIYKLFSWLPCSSKLFKSWKYAPSLYSNIPIRVDKKTYSTPLQKEDLIEFGRLPEKCVILIDEIGALASQWEFDNPLVMENMEKFIRFFRHFLDGKMFVTDQVSDNIVKPIRSRLGIIYNLHDFHRYLGFMPFYKVTAIPMLMIEDNNSLNTQLEYESEYFFGGFPMFFREKNKNYESRSYKPLYTSNAVRTVDNWGENLFTTYLIDISVSDSLKRDYQKHRDLYKAYLYEQFNKTEENAVQDCDAVQDCVKQDIVISFDTEENAENTADGKQ